MSRYVIDAPTLLHLLVNDVHVSPENRLVAPNRIRSDALQLLLEAVHGGDITEQEALLLHDQLTELKIRLLGDRVSRRTAWGIAREQRWGELRAAEYLAIVRLQADALITVDAEMASKATGVVPLANVEALTS